VRDYGNGQGRRVVAGALAALLLARGAATAVELDDLPPGEGREDTFYLCGACHSFNLVSRQGMSRGMWDNTLTLMVERHGMLELEDWERTLILDYLTAAYPPSQAPAAGWSNPFAQR
jgi:hypothetical protein